MRLLLRTFVLLIVALPLLLVAALVMSLQDAPVVTRSAPLTAQDIERAKRIIEEQKPRRMTRGACEQSPLTSATST